MKGRHRRVLATAQYHDTNPQTPRWFVAIARGVKYLHACQPTIVHRDLKLENILLTTRDAASCEAKVVDLGLHMRGRTVGGDNEGSFYGGHAFDAAHHDGSLSARRTAAHGVGEESGGRREGGEEGGDGLGGCTLRRLPCSAQLLAGTFPFCSRVVVGLS